MRFDLRTPCNNCPFLRKGGVRLYKARVLQIAGAMLDSQGATFACHKTTGITGRARTGLQHCAGALIFAEENGNATQMMRIAERLRIYDPNLLQGRRRVFKTLDEMLMTSISPQLTPRRTVKKNLTGRRSL